ncbi:protein of unknown function DUF115 [Syntrophotalea carbinolica DSM 2380]|uniref:6-hydroxymethylpterin diphosphokinase MptE-like domain-containing protein n=2 Tax=Syntrophotalea carbinolica TaxID=19 RepID=Q3A5G3_SYNC1|nr:protein of unknown function DUF115 [Syntrophotalea carbinolica DSM 2380]
MVSSPDNKPESMANPPEPQRLDFMAENFAILSRRWPELARHIEKAADNLPPFTLVEKTDRTLFIDGIHLASAYNRQAEAQLQASMVPDGSPCAHVYGMAIGDLPRILLKRDSIRELTVVVMNCAVAALSLYFFDHRDWLDDPRLTLVAAAPTDRIKEPFAVAPGPLQLACDQASRLRDLVCLELATPFIRKRHRPDNPHLQKRLTENSEFVANDPSFTELTASSRYRTVVVAAAGPTLSDHYAWMKDHKPGPIIAVDAALKPLLQAGIVPEVVVTIDGHADVYDLFFADVDLALLRESALVYFPVVQNQTLQHWPGRRYAAWSKAPIFADLTKRYPRSALFSSGSVIHPAVDLATRLTGENIILAGADFGYPNGQSHVAGCAQAQPVQGSHWVLNSHGERISSIPNLRAYLRDLEGFIAGKNELKFFNASPEGAAILHTELLTELP